MTTNQEFAASSEQVCQSKCVGLMLSKLPKEIVLDILLTLPIETLSALRAVNRAWYHTIKHPDFIKVYNTNVIHNRNSPLFIHSDEFHDVWQKDEKPRLLQWPFKFMRLQLRSSDHERTHGDPKTSLMFYNKSPPISQVYSCHGFFLCISKPEDPYLICNPLTGQHWVVPKPPVQPHRRLLIGFGWDPVSKAFKILRLMDNGTHKLYYGTYLHVYDSGACKWRVVRSTRTTPRVSSLSRFGHIPNIFLNGSLHWLAYPYNGSLTIMSFNLATEKFRQVPMPRELDLDPVESRPTFHYFGIGIPRDTRTFLHHLLVLGECLSLVHNVSNEHVEIWVMKRYGLRSSWEKGYIIRNVFVRGDENYENSVKGPYKLVKLMKNGEILLLCSDEIIGYYEPATKYFRHVNCGDVLYHPVVSRPPLCMGSLIYLEEKHRTTIN